VLNFDLNEWEISKGGDEFLQGFTPRLSEIVCSQQFRKEIQSIIVEGHASSEGSDQTNFEISQKRSGAVVTKSLDVLGAGGHLATLNCFAGFVSAAGRGKREPVFDKATHQEDRDASRRVIFKIRIRSIEQRELLEIIGGVQATAGAR
jgi:outer membrane protein OmpA-like peptidoglycan-associated protein